MLEPCIILVGRKLKGQQLVEMQRAFRQICRDGSELPEQDRQLNMCNEPSVASGSSAGIMNLPNSIRPGKRRNAAGIYLLERGSIESEAFNSGEAADS